jgi:hypothetical protein
MRIHCSIAGLSKASPGLEGKPSPHEKESSGKQVNGYERLEKGDVGDHSDRVTNVPGVEKRAWWKDRDILVACGSYGMLALVFIILGEGLRMILDSQGAQLRRCKRNIRDKNVCSQKALV